MKRNNSKLGFVFLLFVTVFLFSVIVLNADSRDNQAKSCVPKEQVRSLINIDNRGYELAGLAIKINTDKYEFLEKNNLQGALRQVQAYQLIYKELNTLTASRAAIVKEMNL
jgi:hypothetical protein